MITQLRQLAARRPRTVWYVAGAIDALIVAAIVAAIV